MLSALTTIDPNRAIVAFLISVVLGLCAFVFRVIRARRRGKGEKK